MYPEAPVTRQRTDDAMPSSVTQALAWAITGAGGRACALPPARQADPDRGEGYEVTARAAT